RPRRSAEPGARAAAYRQPAGISVIGPLLKPKRRKACAAAGRGGCRGWRGSASVEDEGDRVAVADGGESDDPAVVVEPEVVLAVGADAVAAGGDLLALDFHVFAAAARHGSGVEPAALARHHHVGLEDVR